MLDIKDRKAALVGALILNIVLLIVVVLWNKKVGEQLQATQERLEGYEKMRTVWVQKLSAKGGPVKKDTKKLSTDSINEPIQVQSVPVALWQLEMQSPCADSHLQLKAVDAKSNKVLIDWQCQEQGKR